MEERERLKKIRDVKVKGAVLVLVSVIMVVMEEMWWSW